MSDDLEWAKIRKQKPSQFEEAGSGVLRAALLFGGLVIALGLFATPFIDRDSDRRILANNISQIDPMTTASTRPNSANQYTIRRSVLHKSPNAKCIIHANGFATGAC